MPMGDVSEKFRSFGWKIYKIDGHSIEEIIKTLDEITSDDSLEQPAMIISETVKGKGVSFMENVADWHGKAPSKEQAEEAIKHIEALLDSAL